MLATGATPLAQLGHGDTGHDALDLGRRQRRGALPPVPALQQLVYDARVDAIGEEVAGEPRQRGVALAFAQLPGSERAILLDGARPVMFRLSQGFEAATPGTAPCRDRWGASLEPSVATAGIVAAPGITT